MSITQITLTKPCPVLDGSKDISNCHRGPTLKPGTYDMEEIPHPYKLANATWVVVRGTKFGFADVGWRANAAIKSSGIVLKEA